jgi:hypothetical protein
MEAEEYCDGPTGALKGVEVRAVDLYRHAFTPLRLYGADDLRSVALRILVISDRYIHSLSGEYLCNSCANTSTCSRHESPFSS